MLTTSERDDVIEDDDDGKMNPDVDSDLASLLPNCVKGAGRQKSGRVQRCGEQAGSEGGGSGDSQATRGARGVRGGPRTPCCTVTT
ncbi:hypothetical protein ACOMHN_023626 [Nucella lapillus]